LADALDSPAWWTNVSQLYGSLEALAVSHPGKGLTNALNGDYHSDGGDVHGGLAQWVQDHPPAPETEG
jgi:hypothetical protein